MHVFISKQLHLNFPKFPLQQPWILQLVRIFKVVGRDVLAAPLCHGGWQYRLAFQAFSSQSWPK
jgi:hypothetical protein